MNFGERIYELRSKHGMSQGDLAEKLQVSRQAVSKWENNSAVPDLDKLLKMCELFSVSLDELVKGEKIETAQDDTAEKVIPPAVIRQSLPMRKIVGLVLFGMAFLTALALFIMGGFWGILYALPFLIFGLICFFCEKHTGLKCLWAGNFMVVAFTALAMGISASAVRYTFSWTYTMNYGRLAIAWALAVFNLFVIIFTAVKLGKEPLKYPEKAKKTFIISLISIVGVYALTFIEGAVSSNIIQDMLSLGDYNHTFSFFLNCFGVIEQYMIEIVLAFALTSAIRYIKNKKA